MYMISRGMGEKWRPMACLYSFFGNLKGFAAPDSVLTGPETRSSSPVRIVRDESGQSIGLSGLYPAGEGAGYAGGIMSAALDGIQTAEALIQELERRYGQ